MPETRPPIHLAHYLDGWPLCWGLDYVGPYVATRKDEDVTCPKCLEYMKEF